MTLSNNITGVTMNERAFHGLIVAARVQINFVPSHTPLPLLLHTNGIKNSFCPRRRRLLYIRVFYDLPNETLAAAAAASERLLSLRGSSCEYVYAIY